MVSLDEVFALAQEYGYDRAESSGKWMGYDTYTPIYADGETGYTGPPMFIIVNGDNTRMSTPQEAYSGIGLERIVFEDGG